MPEVKKSQRAVGNIKPTRLLTRRARTSWVCKRMICTGSWYIGGRDGCIVTVQVANADASGSTTSTELCIWVAGNVTPGFVGVGVSNLA